MPVASLIDGMAIVQRIAGDKTTLEEIASAVLVVGITGLEPGEG